MENLRKGLIQGVLWCLGVFICSVALTGRYTAERQRTSTAGYTSITWVWDLVTRGQGFQWGWSGHPANWVNQQRLRKNTGSSDWARLWKRESLMPEGIRKKALAKNAKADTKNIFHDRKFAPHYWNSELLSPGIILQATCSTGVNRSGWRILA